MELNGGHSILTWEKWHLESLRPQYSQFLVVLVLRTSQEYPSCRSLIKKQ